MQDLLTLAERQPDHPAVQWCYAAASNIRELTEKYGVGYCMSSSWYGGAVSGRIVATWFKRTKSKFELAGWTARRIVEDPDTAKWLHSTAPTRRVIYG